MMKRLGFTLAEVLVTLAVIGVVAAVVMPSLGRLQPNQNMLMMKKAYYLTSRTVTELINDEDLYPEANDAEHEGFANINNNPRARYHGREYFGESKFCGLFAARLNLRGQESCDAYYGRYFGAPGGRFNFQTTDGMMWRVPAGLPGTFRAGDATPSIHIDVNGDRDPNCYPGEAHCTNPDRMEIVLDRFGRIEIPNEGTRIMLTANDVTKTYDEIRRRH